MGLLDEWRQVHAEMVAEAQAASATAARMAANAERFGRLLAEAESKMAAKAALPSQIAYDRTQLDAPPTPVQPAPARQNGDGEVYETFQASTLHVMDDGEKKTFKAKGGQWKKWGVFIWPEVLLSEFEIDGEELKPGLYEFKHSCRVLMDGKNPKKVVGKA